ncbi:hypothetical protein [Streptosporangium sp. NPDC020145]|uniref:hypothetical protein n=1 Tax=Streptosporangium sp. NPDC020145 TaxID=3154694 RepID=UPI003442AC1E
MRAITLNLGYPGPTGGKLAEMLTQIADLKPDFLGVQGAKGWEKANAPFPYGGQVFHTAEETLNMRGYLVPSAHDGHHLVGFVSEAVRVVGQDHEVGAPFWHGVVCLDLRMGDHDFRGVVTQAAPDSPRLREIEAEALAEKTKVERVVMLGGWNAVPTSHPGGGPRRKNDVAAARALEEVNLLDAATEVGNATPTVLTPMPYQSDRVYFKGLTVKTVQIVGVGSKHAAAVVDFAIPTQSGAA